MAAQRIAENLAFINWTLLTGLGVGAFGAVVLMRLRTSATRGFLGFTAACAAGFGLLAHLSDGALVQAAAAPGSTVVLDPAWDAPRRRRAGRVRRARARLRPGPGPAGAPAAIGARRAARRESRPWRSGRWPGVAAPSACSSLLGQDLLLAAATGGVFVAMILGHWYLVTPKLPEAPLILLSRVLFGLVAAQVVLFGASMLLGAGSGGGPFSPLTGPWALFVWLRLLVGLVFPLVVSWAAIQTARTPVDGVGNRPAVHQRRLDRGGHDPRRRAVLWSRA